MDLKREEIRILCQTNPEAILTLIEHYQAKIEHQEAKIEHYEARIAQLEARIAELEAQLNQNSRNSSRPPSTDGFKRPKRPRKKGERPPGGQVGHKGQTLEMADPDQIETHTVSTDEKCGASLEKSINHGRKSAGP